MERKQVATSKAPAAIGPYSQAVQFGEIVYTSGQIGLIAETGTMISDSVAEQTKQVLKNLQQVAEACGASLNDIIKTTIFLNDMNDFKIVNEIYGEFFVEPFPARSTVEVARLPLDAKVEIEAVIKVP